MADEIEQKTEEHQYPPPEPKKLSGKVTAIDIGHFTLMVPQEMMHFMLKGFLSPVALRLEDLSSHYDDGTLPGDDKEDDNG